MCFIAYLSICTKYGCSIRTAYRRTIKDRRNYVRFWRESSLSNECINWAVVKADRELSQRDGQKLLPLRLYERVDLLEPWKLWRLTPKEGLSVVRCMSFLLEFLVLRVFSIKMMYSYFIYSSIPLDFIYCIGSRKTANALARVPVL